MTTETKLLTADDLLRLSSDSCRYELIHGELVKMPPSGQQHGSLAALVLISLGQHVSRGKLGKVYAAETGFKLATNPDHVRAPDVAFISKRRLDAVGEFEGFWPSAPDLVVEVVSPSDTYTQVEEKVFDWLEAGSRMVLVVNPRKQAVTVYRSFADVRVLGMQDHVDGADVVPGWTLEIAQLFA